MTIVRRLSGSGDMTFGQGLANFAKASEACAQNVTTRLKLILGEWFLDTSAGVPYVETIFKEHVPQQLVEAQFKQTILETTDVQTLNSFSMTLNHKDRNASISVGITTVYNDVLNINVTV